MQIANNTWGFRLVENWFCSNCFSHIILAHHSFAFDWSLMYFIVSGNCKALNFMWNCIYRKYHGGSVSELCSRIYVLISARIYVTWCGHTFTYNVVCTFLGTMVCAHIYVRSREAISSSGPSMGGLNRPQEGVPLSDKRLFFVLRNADFRFRFSSCTQIAIWSLCHILSG